MYPTSNFEENNVAKCSTAQSFFWTEMSSYRIATLGIGSKKCYVLSFKVLFLYWNISRITKPLAIE